MDRIVFGLVGTGWRADFYRRIALLAPERFGVAAILTRSPERAHDLEVAGGPRVHRDLGDFLATPMDFAVVSVKRGHALPYLDALARAGMPALCETPPAIAVEELDGLWLRHLGSRIQVAEQYFLSPLYAAWLRAVEAGLLGEVGAVSLSAVHGYHAASLFRKFLGLGPGPFTVTGRSHSLPLVATMGREGFDFSGRLMEIRRDRLTIEFAGGGLAFYDFTHAQYHSTIRTRQLNIQGTRGEIDDLSIRYLKPDNTAVHECLDREDLGVYGIQGWAHRGLRLGERELYRNPLGNARLNDDEIAVATCLLRMKRYLDTGEPFYALQEALEDTYISLMMERAIAETGTIVASTPRPWSSSPETRVGT